MHLGGYAPVELIKRTPTGQELIQRYGRSFVIQEGRRVLGGVGVEFYRGTQKTTSAARNRVGGPASRRPLVASRAISGHRRFARDSTYDEQ